MPYERVWIAPAAVLEYRGIRFYAVHECDDRERQVLPFAFTLSPSEHDRNLTFDVRALDGYDPTKPPLDNLRRMVDAGVFGTEDRSEHDLYTDLDADAPKEIRDRNGAVVLGLCKKCRRAEVELSEPCTPRDVTVLKTRSVGKSEAQAMPDLANTLLASMARAMRPPPPCHTCSGTGLFQQYVCPDCAGAGVLFKEVS